MVSGSLHHGGMHIFHPNVVTSILYASTNNTRHQIHRRKKRSSSFMQMPFSFMQLSMPQTWTPSGSMPIIIMVAAPSQSPELDKLIYLLNETPSTQSLIIQHARQVTLHLSPCSDCQSILTALKGHSRKSKSGLRRNLDTRDTGPSDPWHGVLNDIEACAMGKSC